MSENDNSLNNNDELLKIVFKILSYKIDQIISIKKGINYKISNNNLVINNRIGFINNIYKQLVKEDKKIYDFIRIYIDHCINISQLLIFELENKKLDHVYINHHKSNILFNHIHVQEDKLFILYKLTLLLSKSIIGLNNINLSHEYNILLWDIKKIICYYVLSNLKYLYSIYDKLHERYNIKYLDLIDIKNNVIYLL